MGVKLPSLFLGGNVSNRPAAALLGFGVVGVGSSAEIAASSAPPHRADPSVPIEPGQPEPSTIRAVSELRIGAHRL